MLLKETIYCKRPKELAAAAKVRSVDLALQIVQASAFVGLPLLCLGTAHVSKTFDSRFGAVFVGSLVFFRAPCALIHTALPLSSLQFPETQRSWNKDCEHPLKGQEILVNPITNLLTNQQWGLDQQMAIRSLEH